jgi:hypothetical protein
MTKTVWIVRWRGFEEERAGRQDAMDRWGQLDARGIEAELLEVAEDGQEQPITLTDILPSAITAGDAVGRRQGKPLGAPRARARFQVSARGK